MPTFIEKHGSTEIWRTLQPWGVEFMVYGITADPRTVPSLGMAREIAAGC